VAQKARDQGNPTLAFQLLIYPATDFTFSGASLKENADGYFLTTEDMHWFSSHYLRSEADKKNPLASPLLAANLSRLPPALIITAQYDPLRDEGEVYGKRLKEAGVPVTTSRYAGMIHGFFGFPLIPVSAPWMKPARHCAQRSPENKRQAQRYTAPAPLALHLA
jgi:acetyl esterase